MNPDYTPFHPKWHRTRIPIFWWLRKGAYTLFICRELTSLFVAYTALLILLEARVVTQGPGAYAAFTAWLERPTVITLHTVVFAGLLFHTATWLNLAPQALVVRVGGRRIPSRVVLLAHWAGFVAVSGLLGWLLLGGP